MSETGPMTGRVDLALCRRSGAAERLRGLLKATAEACHGAEATLWVVSGDGLHLQGALNHGARPDVLESVSVPIADSVSGVVAATGLATSIGPDDEHNTSVDEATGIETRAMAAAPVLIEGEVVGVLTTINPTREEVFSGGDLRNLELQAHEIGIALAEELDRD